jgi:ATP-dependent DNA helicase PIF1
MGVIDVRLKQVPFGGKIVLMGGDFRQVLPVVKHGNRASIVGATLPSSPLWRHIDKHALTVNMRVHHRQLEAGADADRLRAFAELLLRIGEGRQEGGAENVLRVPEEMLLDSTAVGDLITAIFGQHPHLLPPDELASRAILTPKNLDVDAINEAMAALFPGAERVYHSADSVGQDDEADVYQPEFLNSINPQGFPTHALRLKVGLIIILLRNINPLQGLANGTRLRITHLTQYLIQAVILTGNKQGTTVLIPRTRLTDSDSDYPFTLTRYQYPVRVAFAMSINKVRILTPPLPYSAYISPSHMPSLSHMPHVL